MNTVIKKVLLELMSYSNTRQLRESDIYIKKAQEKLGDESFQIRAENLLSWIDPRRNSFTFTSLEKYEIYEDFMEAEVIDTITEEYAVLFKLLPELNEIFEFKGLYIAFNSSLSKSDIQEIYDFVKTNYIINPSRISFYIRPPKE